MKTEVARRFESDIAGWIHSALLLEEEHRPLPEQPSPAMLVARVTERLGQAAVVIERDRDRPVKETDVLQVGVCFIGAGAFAITAIAHIDSNGAESQLVKVKDALLNQLDHDVLESLEADEDFYAEATPGALLSLCLSRLTGACQCVSELEGANALPPDEGDEDMRLEVTDSLWETAVAAAAAGQRLVKRHPRSATRTASVRAARGTKAATPSPPRTL